MGEVCRSGEGMWDRSTGYREQMGGIVALLCPINQDLDDQS